jgi:hypothetical protein
VKLRDLVFPQRMHGLGVMLLEAHLTFWFAKVSSNNALPDDDDCTETCRSCFNVNFNVNFKIVFKTVHLCISWWIKKL